MDATTELNHMRQDEEAVYMRHAWSIVRSNGSMVRVSACWSQSIMQSGSRHVASCKLLLDLRTACLPVRILCMGRV